MMMVILVEYRLNINEYTHDNIVNDDSGLIITTLTMIRSEVNSIELYWSLW